MPTLDRKPRRRLNATRNADFSSEVEAREAAAAVRAMPEGADRDAAWQALRPRLERWVGALCRTRVTPEQIAALARIYVFRPAFLPSLPPPNYRPDA